MSPELIHCSICHKAFRVENFKDALDKLRHHRKLVHPKAFKASSKKGLKTRKKNK